MEANTAVYEGLKSFLDFGDKDAENLKSLGPIMETHGKTLTDRFYEKLAGVPETAKLIEGRVDALKQTHTRWMSELFAGDYGEGYFNSRWKIGLTHVKVGVPPHYVEAVVSFLRVESEHVLAKELSGDDVADKHGSLTKILDLDLMIINLAYAFERVDRLCQFTGMSRKLIERCIEKG
jgi:hemoglobin-like flavoprotein